MYEFKMENVLSSLCCVLYARLGPNSFRITSFDSFLKNLQATVENINNTIKGSQHSKWLARH